MHLLVHRMMASSDPAQNTATLWGLIKDEYKSQGISNKFGNMKMSMFSAKGCAKLRGTASVVRAFGPVLYQIWLKFYNPERELDQRVELVLRTGYHLERILDRNASEYALSGIHKDCAYFVLCFFCSLFVLLFFCVLLF